MGRFVEDISNSSLTDAKYAENRTDLTSLYDEPVVNALSACTS